VLTLVEAISLAGDRAKQNDDACGFAGARAWVIDGATDFHKDKLTGAASDAAWLAHSANAHLHAVQGGVLRDVVRDVSEVAAEAYARIAKPAAERWMLPIASLLMVEEEAEGLSGIDLGDCRLFALDADGNAQIAGGPGDAGDNETQLAAQQTDGDKPLLDRTDTMKVLRANRAAMNRPGAPWTFGLDPTCADEARVWTLTIKRPAHVLLLTDGFSSLVDRYRVYDAGGSVRAALDKGLQELAREIRAIENEDAGGAAHPRFKKSDDATALLLRLT